MQASLPPGPPWPSFVQGIGLWSRPLAYPERLRLRYGTPFTVRFPLTPPFVIFDEPEAVKRIFTAPPDVLAPGEGANVLLPIVGPSSVLLLDGDAHMEQRKLLLPAFHGERMAKLAGLVRSIAAEELDRWPGHGTLALHPRMQQLTLEVILRAVFGLDPGRRLDSLREMLTRLLAYGEEPITLLGEPPAWLMPLLDRFGPVAGFDTMRKRIDELIFELIRERRAEGAERDDVLSMLLQARHEDGSPMSEEELRDELMTLLVAGHETTATALAWTFERLSRERRVTDRLRAEQKAGDGDAYLTATIHEALRSAPVLPNTMPRYVKQPFELGGRTYEPGCCLVANSYLLHHNPAVYDDPYTFRPERFLDEQPGTYTWIPFGGGRRRCLGASFALLEMKIVLPAVLERWDFEAASPAHEAPVRRNITVRPRDGAALAVAPRAREREAVAA